MAPDETRSLAQRLADMPFEEREEVLADLSIDERAALADFWPVWARPDQLPPPGEWHTWYIRGGRGSGKTRAAAEFLAEMIRTAPRLRDGRAGEWAVIAPTLAGARDVCMEGESGLLRALGSEVANWNRSSGELVTHSGARVFAATAEEGAVRIQGKNLRGAWCDEVGLWKGDWRMAWEESIAFAVRIDPIKIVATGTPKGNLGLVAHLMEDEQVVKSHLRTSDNADNLSEVKLAELADRYAGTRLGRQELEGEVLEDVEGALWSRGQIDRLRIDQAPELKRVVVAIDPAVTSGERADETGIIVAGVDASGIGYVIADLSCRMSPDGWARRAVRAYREFSGQDRG